MANVIAVIWDFDKTLVDGYMQDPIFSHYGVDGNQFWKEVHELPEKYWKEQGVRVNRDTIYLNHFLRYVREGIFPDLNNEKLKTFGKELQFYPGIPEIFEKTKRMIADDPHYKEYDIKVEHYIVSTGMMAVIKGTAIMDYVDGVWGNELIEDEINGRKDIAELGYTIDNTSKTRAIFEINKGVPKHPEIDVNSKVPAHKRRVPFENMIYIADGPSDIPAFSLLPLLWLVLKSQLHWHRLHYRPSRSSFSLLIPVYAVPKASFAPDMHLSVHDILPLHLLSSYILPDVL